MSRRNMALLMVAVLVLSTAGCVERMISIRSDPPGAPVWVDERRVGVTPVEYGFAHYGSRRVRVGPIRTEHGKVQYAEQEKVFDIRAPWYEKFPIDFFFEALYPVKLVDQHELPLLVLEEPKMDSEPYTDPQVKDLIDRAESFREQAMNPAEGD